MRIKTFKSFTAMLLAILLFFGTSFSPVYEVSAIDEVTSDSDAPVEEEKDKLSEYFINIGDASTPEYLQSDNKKNLMFGVFNSSSNENLGSLVRDESDHLKYYFTEDLINEIKEADANTVFKYLVLDFEYQSNGNFKYSDLLENEKINCCVTKNSNSNPQEYYKNFFEGYNGIYDGDSHPLVSMDNESEAFDNITVEYLDTVYTKEIPKKTDCGKYTTKVKLTQGYDSITFSIDSTINKNNKYAEFKESELSVSLAEKNKSNAVVSVDEDLINSKNLKVTYSIPEEYDDYAEVDSVGGKVTVKKVTESPIKVNATVSVEGNENFEKISLSYNLTITKDNIGSDGVKWSLNNSEVEDYTIDTDYAENLIFNCELKKADGKAFSKGEVKYSIVSQKRDGKKVTDCVEIDSQTGKVTVKTAGEFVIKAVPNSDIYNYTEEDIPTLTFKINKIEREDEISFADSSTTEIEYGEYLNVSLSGISQDTNYSLAVDDETLADIKKDAYGNYLLNPKGVGTVEITATVLSDNIYKEKTFTKKITIKKCQTTMTLKDENAQSITDDKLYVNVGKANKGLTYSLECDNKGAEYEVNYVEKDSSNPIINKVDVKDGKLEIKFEENKLGSAKITVSTPETDCYEAASITLDVTVKFGEIKLGYNIVGTKGNNVWYKSEVTIKSKNEYKISEDPFPESWSDEIKYSENGIHEISDIYYKDNNGLIYKETEPLSSIYVDKTAPKLQSIYVDDKLLEDNHFTNQNTTTIKLIVKEAMSGVSTISYSLDGKSYTQIAPDSYSIDENGNVTATVPLKCESGEVLINNPLSVKVVDKAGWETLSSSEYDIIIDRKSPENKSYAVTRKDATDGSAPVDISVTFSDDSFFEGGSFVESILLKDLDNGSTRLLENNEYTITCVDNELTIDFELKDYGNYNFKIEIKDSCNNEIIWDSTSKRAVEVLSPFRSSKLDLSSAESTSNVENTFNVIPNAVFSVETNRLKYENFVVQCDVKDKDGKDISNNIANNIQTYLQSKDNWTSTNGSFVTDFGSLLTVDGIYKITIIYNNNISFEYNNDTCDEQMPSPLNTNTKEFTIDRKAPSDLSFEIFDDVSQCVTNTLFPFFFNNDIKIVFSAKDNISGIDHYEYTTDGTTYKLFVGEEVVLTPPLNIFFNFKAYDKANNSISYSEYRKNQSSDETDYLDNIVLDNEPPVITIYDNGCCFEDNGVVSFEIKEDYPNEDGLTVLLERNNSLKEDDFSEVTCTANLESSDGDIQKYNIELNDLGEYKLTVNYTDKANNDAEQKVAYFKVISSGDKTTDDKKLFEIELDSEALCQGSLYSGDVTATVKKNDHLYFEPGLLEVTCELSNVSGEVDAKNRGEKLSAQFTKIIQNKDNWIKNSDGYELKEKFNFTDSALFTLTVKYNGKAKCSSTFTVDKEEPEIRNIVWTAGIEKTIDNENYVFYTKGQEACVEFDVADLTSGIKSVMYKFGDDIQNTLNKTENGHYSISIPDNYTGKVVITVKDNAGRFSINSVLKMPKFVTDSIDPTINVTLEGSPNSGSDVKYFSTGVSFTVKINEKNFFNDIADITVEKKTGDKWETVDIDTKWSSVDSNNDQKTFSTRFTEQGEYRYTVKCSDYSKNIAEPSTGSFVIDKTQPKVTISYANQDDNKEFVNKNQTAVITVIDDNLPLNEDGTVKPTQIVLKKEICQNDGTTTVIEDEITDSPSLKFTKKNGNTYTAEVSLNVDGELSSKFEIYASFTDLANLSGSAEESIVVDKEQPNVFINYDNMTKSNSTDKYYSKNGDITISIVDVNLQTTELANKGLVLDSDSVDVKVTKTFYNNDGTTETVTDDCEDLIFCIDLKQEYRYSAVYKNSMINVKGDSEKQYKNCVIKVEVHVLDKAGNSADESDSVTVDEEKPTVNIAYVNKDSLEDSIDTERKYFKEDVNIIVSITDANLKTVTDEETGETIIDTGVEDVTVTKTYYNNDGTVITIKDECEELKFFADDTAENTYKATYPIDIVYVDEEENEEYKNCDIDVKVMVKDKADNQTDQGDKIVIDKEKPTVTVTYDTSNCSNEAKDCSVHNHTVKATISIKDSNIAFSGKMGEEVELSDCLFSLKTTGYNNAGEKVDFETSPEVDENSYFKPQFTWNENSNVYTATVEFTPDSEQAINVDYEINIVVEDIAGNKAESSKTENGDIIEKFTIDNELPTISVNNKVGSSDGEDVYYNSNQTLEFVITDAHLDAERCNLVVKKRTDDSTEFVPCSDDEFSIELKKAEDSKNKYNAVLKFTQSADYEVSLSVTDLAGNKVKDPYETKFTVDKILPKVTIEYDNNSAKNKKYFNSTRTATIVVEEHNFNPKQGNTLTVTATDNQGIKVTSYQNTITEWKKNGDIYTAKVEFLEDANYEFSFECKDLAENMNGEIDYKDSMSPNNFTVDTGTPSGSITVGNWATDSDLRNEYSYNQFSNESQTITLLNEDSLSGVDYVEYMISSLTLNRSQLAKQTEWVDCAKSNYSFTLAPNNKFIVYMHIVDKAGNEKYISSNGVILDDVEPEIETLAPEITIIPANNSSSNLFNSDVPFNVKVVEPLANNVYSGIKTVTYEVINMGTVTSQGVLYSTDTPEIQEYEKSSAIVADSSSNNSNDVTVRVTATDFADNTSSKEYAFAIDITDPVISLSYDNNDARNEKYFKDSRIATIEITERNFSPDNFSIKIKNEYGSVPSVGGWSKVNSGSGNGDDTVWAATVEFSNDGAYSVDMSTVDEAGNSCDSFSATGTAPLNFVIDKTSPQLVVSYDNNNVYEKNYYSADRTATVSIAERNFNSSDVKASVSAELNGVAITAPSLSSWNNAGNNHSATIKYNKDGDYKFSITYTDLAGNSIETYTPDEFHIDKTKANISISGVKNNTSYSGDVAPVITITDNNFSRKNTVITLTGASRGKVTDLSSLTSEKTLENGVVITFENFEEKKDIDDIYTLNVSHSDLAGNKTVSQVKFSVNRFGSTYEFNDATSQLNNKYVKTPTDIVITEINVATIKEHTVTVYRDGVATVLKEGQDYSFEKEPDEANWCKYTYTIFASNFAEDGVYSIKISSVDEAGNVAENALDTKEKDLTFAVDNTPPEVFVTNVESGVTYPVTSLNAIISANDNIQISSLIVYLDDKQVQVWDEEQINSIILNNEDFTFEISGDSTSSHNMNIVCTDKAGNTTELEINRFYVTTNMLVRFFNNKIVLFSSIIGLLLIVVVIILLVLKKKRKRNFN